MQSTTTLYLSFFYFIQLFKYHIFYTESYFIILRVYFWFLGSRDKVVQIRVEAQKFRETLRWIIMRGQLHALAVFPTGKDFRQQAEGWAPKGSLDEVLGIERLSSISYPVTILTELSLSLLFINNATC